MSERKITSCRRRFPEDDPFFDDGNSGRPNAVSCMPLPLSAKKSITELSKTENDPSATICLNKEGKKLPKYLQSTNMLGMAKEHIHRCKECSRSFASDRLLDMHLSETHDSFFAILAERQPSFRCLVDGCDTVWWSDKERRVHLIEDHRFPETYDFHKPALRKKVIKATKYRSGDKHENSFEGVSDGDTQMVIDEAHPTHQRCRKAKKREKKKEKQKQVNMNMDVEMEVDEPHRGIGAKVPASISFGRRGRMTGRLA
jgi:hypothetical protein